MREDEIVGWVVVSEKVKTVEIFNAAGDYVQVMVIKN